MSVVTVQYVSQNSQGIHAGDIGTAFSLTIKNNENIVPLNDGTDSANIIFLKPDGTTLTKAMTISDGAAGVVSYVTVSGDIDQAGDWQFQLELDIVSTGWNGRSNIVNFPVERAL